MSQHARRRPVAVAVTALLGLVVALLPLRPAHACSCAEPDLTPVVDGARDQALVLAERTDLDGGAEGSLRVLEVLAGADTVGPVDARFDDGASCDPWIGGGAVGALLLAREDERWTTTTCGQVSVGQALAATDDGLAVDATSGPATLLLAGAFGDARLATVDAAGRVAARGGGPGRTLALSRCPDGDVLLEVAQDASEQAVLHRWGLPELESLGAPVALGRSPAFTATVSCRDADGDGALVALPRYGEPGAVAVVDGADVEVTEAPVVHAHAAGGTTAAVLGDGTPQGEPHTIATIADDGTVQPLLRRDDTVFDRVATSPTGVWVAAGGYPPDGGDRVVVAAVDGTTQVDRTLDGFHVLGWLDDARLWLRDDHALAFGAAAATRGVRDTSLTDLGEVETGPAAEPTALPDGGVLRVGGVVPSVLREDAVARVADPRLAGADHGIVLDADAVLTDADVDPVASPDPGPLSGSDLAEPRGVAVGAPWLLVLAGVLVVGLVWAVRRDRRRG